MPDSDKGRTALARVGFFLCREGLIPEAERIFAGLAESAPERAGPDAGLALCLIIRGDADAAASLLDRRLKQDGAGGIPGQLMVYKLLALGMGGRLREAELLRGEMERLGFAGLAGTADAILGDLRRVKAV